MITRYHYVLFFVQIPYNIRKLLLILLVVAHEKRPWSVLYKANHSNSKFVECTTLWPASQILIDANLWMPISK